MRITVTAREIFRYEHGNRITVGSGDTVDVPDQEGRKFVRLGVAVTAPQPVEPEPQPEPEPDEHEEPAQA